MELVAGCIQHKHMSTLIIKLMDVLIFKYIYSAHLCTTLCLKLIHPYLSFRSLQ